MDYRGEYNGVLTIYPRISKPHLGDLIQYAKEDLPTYRVVVSPGCYCTSTNGYYNMRKWYPHFPEVLRYLRDSGIDYVLNLHNRDIEVFKDLEGPRFSGTLVELAVLLAKANLLVTVESGTAHLGTVVGCPVIEILRRYEPGFPTGEARVPLPLKGPVWGLIEDQIVDIDPGLVISKIKEVF